MPGRIVLKALTAFPGIGGKEGLSRGSEAHNRWTRWAQVYLPSPARLHQGRKEEAESDLSAATIFNYSLPSGKFPTQNSSVSIPMFCLQSQVQGLELARNMNCEFTGMERSEAISRGHNPGPSGGCRLIHQGSLQIPLVICVGAPKERPRLSMSSSARF